MERIVDAKTYISRVGELCNLVAKPELNGNFVVVVSFDSERERFGVRPLVPPNALNAVAQSISVKVNSIQLREKVTFVNRFPDAKVGKASSFLPVIKQGTILDFSQAPVPSPTFIPLFVNKSCLCRGAASALSSTGQASPTTVVRIDLVVQVEEGGGIVEFEDLNFDDVQGSGGVCVAQAGHVTFRRCRFHGAYFGAATGLNNTLCVHSEFCHATFESCVFEGNPKGDIVVRELSHVTMINCVLHGPILCVDVQEGGKFTAIHCTFHGAVQALDKVPLFELTYCSVLGGGEHGVHMGNGTSARLIGCRVMRCKGDGIVGKGLRRLHAHIEDCVVTECRIGFLFDVGKMDVTLRNCHAYSNAFHGLHLCPTLVSSVVVEKCTFRDNHGSMDVFKLSGPHCAVTIDGALQPLRVDSEFLRLIQGKYWMSELPQAGAKRGEV